MGAWGPAIFSDDTACDVRDDYRELIGQGVTGTEATRRLVEEYRPDDDPDDTGFWLGLAATQWKLGRLEDTVKARALQVIEDGTDLRHWEDATPQDVRKRRAALDKLKEQLLLPQPPPKHIRRPYHEWTEWEVGDVVSYRLLSGRYILLRVVGHDTSQWERGPIVEIVDWVGDEPPPPDAIATLPARRPTAKREERHLYSTRFEVARRSKTDYPANRLSVVARGVPVAPWPKVKRSHPDYSWSVTWWKELDQLLRGGFGLE